MSSYVTHARKEVKRGKPKPRSLHFISRVRKVRNHRLITSLSDSFFLDKCSWFRGVQLVSSTDASLMKVMDPLFYSREGLSPFARLMKATDCFFPLVNARPLLPV
ncbi:hypothetical protein CDAR_597051 [Caerostris darwini]|uniref:Uncharacterized protein n=1 Tax=Caerostris darwini TaxID=1538125 RepID=A0AAV4U2C7_9ARAC|nr:hypothetical protein CDAR_597051 [Caerostris darwini]